MKRAGEVETYSGLIFKTHLKKITQITKQNKRRAAAVSVYNAAKQTHVALITKSMIGLFPSVNVQPSYDSMLHMVQMVKNSCAGQHASVCIGLFVLR